MTHDHYDVAYRIRALGPAFSLLFVLALGLLPLACMSSTADSKEEAEEATLADDGTEEATAYDVPAYTGNRSVAERLKDASLGAQIRRALVRQRDLRIFDFEPAVDGQTVTIEGDVNTHAQWAQVERIVERVAPGRTVVNAVTIGGRPAREAIEDGTNVGAASDQESPSTTEVYHTVQPGESLWEIARRYGASVQRLRSMNSLPTDNLRVGQRIRVR